MTQRNAGLGATLKHQECDDQNTQMRARRRETKFCRRQICGLIRRGADPHRFWLASHECGLLRTLGMTIGWQAVMKVPQV